MFDTLATHRFLLQEIIEDDQSFIFKGLSHPQVIPFYGISFETLAETKAQMDFYKNMLEENTGCWWKIVSQETGDRLGAIGYNNFSKEHKRAEVGYWLLPEYWGQGIVSEVLPVVVDYMFHSKSIHRIEALVESGNEVSCKVLERVGFTYEGLMRDCEIKKGAYISLSIYSLLSTDALKPRI